jgi:chromosome segregation ATPase
METYDVFHKVTENSLAMVEGSLNSLGDELDDIVEKNGLLQSQISLSANELQYYQSEINALNEAYAKGELNPVEYADRLKELSGNVYDIIGNLQKLKDEIVGGFEEALNKGMEDIEKYTQYFDKLNNSLDKYRSIMELLGNGKDYDMIKTIQKGQSTILKDKL